MIHVTALESMAAELNDLGVNVTEHDLITKVVCSLPVQFDFLPSSWDNIPDHEKTMDALRARLVTEQRRITARMTDTKPTIAPSITLNNGSSNATQNPNNESNALYGFGNRGGQTASRSNYRGFGGRRGRQQQRKGQRDQTDKAGAKCTYCGKFGHYEFECRLRIAHEGEKQQGKRANNGEGGGSTPNPYFSLISISCLKATNPEVLYLDSGASRHMSDQRSYFHELNEVEPGSWLINGIGGTVMYAHGIGTIKLIWEVQGKQIQGKIKNVLYVPNLGVTLLSIASITSNGFDVIFSGLTAQVYRDKHLIMTGKRTGETLYQVDAIAKRSPTMGFAASSNHASLTIWHQRLGHVNVRTVSRMAAGVGVTGMSIKRGSGKLDECCHGCNMGKMHKLPFPTSSSKPKVVGELVVSDAVCPIQEPSIGGARYYVLFKDVFSKYKVVYFLKMKSETEESFRSYASKLLVDTGKRVQVSVFRSDNGGEFTSHTFATWLAENGIKHQTCAAHTPEQNGIADKPNVTIVLLSNQPEAKYMPKAPH